MKKFNIKVNGTSYEVEVEEEKVAGAAPAPKAAAPAAAPKAAAPAGPSLVEAARANTPAAKPAPAATATAETAAKD